MREQFSSMFSLMPELSALRTRIPLLMDGVPTFLGVPAAETPDDLKGVDAALIGVPYDRPSSSGRPPDRWLGYRDAPNNIRRLSIRFAGYLPDLDVDVFQYAKLCDYGNAAVVDNDLEQSIANIASKVGEAVHAGCRPITLGGFSPCGTYAVIKGIAEASSGRIGVISLDAHADCLHAEPTGDKIPGPFSWEARMWEHFPNVDPAHHVEIGIRGPSTTRQQVDTYRRNGARMYTSHMVKQMGVDALCREALPRVFDGTDSTWLHIDMDVLDMSAIPNWGTDPLGLSTWDIVKVVYEAGKAGLGGLSLVYVPANSDAMASFVCYIAVYLLAGWIAGGKIPAG